MKRVVLVRTAGPRNLGMVLRAAANFGPCELWLVAPARASLLVHPEFVQMSHGVAERDAIRCVASLPEALADCTRSIGFTARARGHRTRRDWREAAPEWRERCTDPAERVALVFGSEENGLTVEESDRIGELAYLPTASEHTSINLAMAVGIVLSSLFVGRGTHVGESGARLADGEALEYLKRHLKDVLGGEVARGPAARRDIEASIERIFSRAPVETRDARAWHKILRALGSARTPPDYGLGTAPKRGRRQEAVERARRRDEAGD